jgi:valyl-tRNA synthetase
MAKAKFDFKLMEDKWKKYWEKEKIYSTNFSKKKIYSVDTPPPTVSGNMHLGHTFSYSQQDFIVRFRRMFDGCAFYPFGTDDNGLPTERLVEKLNKVKSKDMSRAEFIELCLKTLKKITPEFVQDWKNLGMSCDFNVSYSTIDNNTRKLSQKFFLDLVRKGLAYQKEFPTIWCPECQTSIAQAELEDKGESSLFFTLKFGVDGKDLLIATTRPELLGACVAVFVNPQDKRYKKFVGKKAKVPIFNFEVPIIEDESAEVDKGTGVLMICSYGDKFDVDAINRHNLHPKIILNSNGTLNLKGYEKLKVKEARKKILEDLKNNNLIKEQKIISHVVNVHDKCGTEIEFIPTKQWFIKILDNKEKLVQQAKKINWYPDFMFKRYENWVNGLEWDWSVSRDRHFGIPIPAWECLDCGELILPEDKELPVDPLQTKKKCPKCGKNAEPEKKVLDTWATSSLTPQIASSLIGNKIQIPFSLRPNAHDIIRTWAFYTITRSFLHEKKVPWENIIISGVVSLGGEKMSKSKGNVIDPKTVLKNYGADALRFWAAGSKLGNDLDYQEKDLIAGKKLVTKLLNASKFVFMNLEDYNFKRPKNLILLDEIFLKKLNNLVKIATESFESYDYSRAKLETEQFFWQMFADDYLEIVKKRVYQGEGEKKKSAQYVLYKSLLIILKLFAPIMPFITEEIYQEYFKKQEKDKSIHVSKWPEYQEIKLEDNVFDVFVDLLGKIRQEKSKAQKAMNSEIILTLDRSIKKRLEGVLEDLKNVMNVSEIKEGNFGVEFVEENLKE